MHTKWKSWLDRLSVGLFLVLIFALPLTVRKVVYELPIRETFNEYSSVFIYATDILVLLVLLFGVLKLRNLFTILSMRTFSSPQRECSTWNILRGRCLTHTDLNIWSRIFWISLASFFLIAYLSELWADSHMLSSVFSLRLGLFILLAFYVSRSIVPRGTILYSALFLFSLSAAINAAIGTLQYFLNHSIGLRFLWESILDPRMPGVAKIIIDGAIRIRAYGLLPHPNILGGFIAVSLLINIFLLLKRENVPDFIGKKAVLPLILAISGIQLVGLFFTFSKSAWLGLTMGVCLLILAGNLRLRLRPKIIGLALGIIGIFTIFISGSINPRSIIEQSVSERRAYENVSRGTIYDSPLLGIGAGNLVFSSRNRASLFNWQFQPVHNSYFQIWSELGVLGLVLFLWIIWGLFTGYVPRGTLSTGSGASEVSVLTSILFTICTIMFFDHYFWDIQQGKLILWIFTGILAGYRFKLTDETLPKTV